MPARLLTSLATRDFAPEVMDDPGIDKADHRRALRALARLNRLSGNLGTLAAPIRSLASEVHPRPLRVLDLASGGGDVLRRLARRLRSWNVEWSGCDKSLTAVRHARATARRHSVPASFFRCDVLRDPLPFADVVMCSLFLHHLSRGQAVELLARMADSARRLVLVHDLVRGPCGYLLAKLACHAVTRSAVVHNDGPTSVRNAFTIDEVRALAAEAALQDAVIEGRWPLRFLLSWRKA